MHYGPPYQIFGWAMVQVAHAVAPPMIFLHASTAQTAESICTHDGSNDAVYCKEVPFGGRVDTKLHFGVKNSRKSKVLEPECLISSQINTLE